MFVILKDEDDIEFLLSPDLYGNNVHRVYYVAASRAIKRLFINVPTLSDETASSLKVNLLISIKNKSRMGREYC